MKKFYESINRELEKGNLRVALKKIVRFLQQDNLTEEGGILNNELKKNAYLQSFRLNELRIAENKNLISFEDSSKERAKIFNSTLDLFENIKINHEDLENLTSHEEEMLPVLDESKPLASKKQIIVTLDRDFSDFSVEQQHDFLQAIKYLLNTSEDIKIINIASGSVVLKLLLNKWTAEELIYFIQFGALREIGVVSVKVDDYILYERTFYKVIREAKLNQLQFLRELLNFDKYLLLKIEKEVFVNVFLSLEGAEIEIKIPYGVTGDEVNRLLDEYVSAVKKRIDASSYPEISYIDQWNLFNEQIKRQRITFEKHVKELDTRFSRFKASLDVSFRILGHLMKSDGYEIEIVSQNLKIMVAEGRLEEVIERLKGLARYIDVENVDNILMFLNSKIENVLIRREKKIISRDEEIVERSKISDELVAIINKLSYSNANSSNNDEAGGIFD